MRGIDVSRMRFCRSQPRATAAMTWLIKVRRRAAGPVPTPHRRG